MAHLHYVLIGGYVFPMIAAIYYFLPLLTGKTRFFKLGEIAFWLVVPAFHITFLSIHMAGLLGQRRRTWTYDAGQGWDVLNLVASIAAFVMAIGFALVILDVVVNAFVSRRARRNPWGAKTLEWTAMIPSPAYGFASIPIVKSRYPVDDDPSFAVKIARGEGYLGDALRNQRETLIVTTARGMPSQVAVLPGNSILPFVLAVVTSTSFLAPLVGAYWLAGLSLVGIVVVSLVWAWGLGSRTDKAQINVGHGISLPLASQGADPPSWWGSLFLLLADSVHFGSLLFGYAFLWTIAPNWPPSSYLQPSLWAVGIALVGTGALALGPRLAISALNQGRAPWPTITLSIFGAVALIMAAGTIVMDRPNPSGHAYDATLWLLAGHIGFHASLVTIMLCYLLARVMRGYISKTRIGELYVVKLWADFAAITGLVALGAAWLPGVLL